MVFLATAATVIASQAVISGAFSVSRQAVQLGFLPRLTIRHTSPLAVGQVYVPAVNWAMFVVVVSLVIGFGSSERLGAAYGVAVSATFVITTILFFTIARLRWRWPAWAVAGGVAVFLTVEATFLAANLTKIDRGGWLPLVIAAALVCVMTTWHRGREIVTANRVREEGPLRRFIDALHALDPPLPRVSGTAVFLHPSLETTPLAMRANVEHNHVLHEQVVIVWAKPVDVPHVPPGDRVVVDDLGYSDDNITHVTARFGLQDPPDIPEALRLAQSMGVEWRLGPRAAHLLPLPHLDPGHRCAGDGPLAQEALRRDGPQRGHPRRLLPPAGRAHDHDGIADPALTGYSPRRAGWMTIR